MEKVISAIFLFIALSSSTVMSEDIMEIDSLCSPKIKGIYMGMSIDETMKIIDSLTAKLEIIKEKDEYNRYIKTYKHPKFIIILDAYQDKLISLKLTRTDHKVSRFKSDKLDAYFLKKFRKEHDLPMYSTSYDSVHKLNNYVFEGDCYKILISKNTFLYEYIINQGVVQ